MEEKNKKIVVSDLFLDIYKNFNVGDQTEKMRSLSKRELYLLLTLCLDKHDDANPTVASNLIPFKTEVMDIFSIQDDKGTEVQDLKDLITESGDEYIETDNIVDSKDDKMPDPLTKEEIRDIRIDIIGS